MDPRSRLFPQGLHRPPCPHAHRRHCCVADTNRSWRAGAVMHPTIPSCRRCC